MKEGPAEWLSVELEDPEATLTSAPRTPVEHVDGTSAMQVEQLPWIPTTLSVDQRDHESHEHLVRADSHRGTFRHESPPMRGRMTTCQQTKITMTTPRLTTATHL